MSQKQRWQSRKELNNENRKLKRIQRNGKTTHSLRLEELMFYSSQCSSLLPPWSHLFLGFIFIILKSFFLHSLSSILILCFCFFSMEGAQFSQNCLLPSLSFTFCFVVASLCCIKFLYFHWSFFELSTRCHRYIGLFLCHYRYIVIAVT